MEVRMVTLQNDKAPSSGMALYIVVEERERSVTLLHPVTLTKFEVSAEEYRGGQGPMCWPENQSGYRFDREKIAELMTLKMKDYSQRQKQYPAHVVRRIVSELRGIEIEKVPLYKEPTSSRGPSQRTAKRPGVIDAIVALLDQGHTIDEMVSSLKETFPDRNADGMRTTVRCQINRLPAKLSRKIDRSDDKKRGQIFKFAK